MNLVKLKNQKNGENQVKWEPCKIVLYSALQTYKKKIIQFPILQLNKQIINTYFVYIFLSTYKSNERDHLPCEMISINSRCYRKSYSCTEFKRGLCKIQFRSTLQLSRSKISHSHNQTQERLSYLVYNYKVYRYVFNQKSTSSMYFSQN